jgi:hypothetical protein
LNLLKSRIIKLPINYKDTMSIEAPRLQVITDKVILAELAPIAAMALEAHITQKDKQQWS